MNENQLVTIVQSSGLEKTKADIILNKFQDYFAVAAEWENKAKVLVVTNENQKTDMAMARVGRLFLRQKRLDVENTRKELKEQAIREGKAIDGIANVLKALIVPIEEYLDKQEHFVEIRAKEKAEAEERERIRLENIRLQKEAEEREAEMKRQAAAAAEAARIAAEKQKALEEKARLEREAAAAKQKEIEEKARKEREAAELAAKQEKERQEKILAEQKAKADAEKRALEDKARKEKAEAEEKARKLKAEQDAKIKAERLEKERLQKILDSAIVCPHCGKKLTPDGKKVE